MSNFRTTARTRGVTQTHEFATAASAALFGAALLLAPVSAALAQTDMAAPAEASAARHSAMTRGHSAKHETIDQRIMALHASLKITPEEEPQWTAVATTMRDNEAAMLKLGADEEAAPHENATALDDLKAYQKFAQAHVDGLTKLIASFDTLYAEMPDQQKKVADQVFAQVGHKASHGRS